MKVVEAFHPNSRRVVDTEKVNFSRHELTKILKIYGQMVSKGEWRDYSISSLSSKAIFSIFRRTSENPLYMIIKTPKLAKKHATFSIVAMNGMTLKQGNDLQSIIQIFNKNLFKLI